MEMVTIRYLDTTVSENKSNSETHKVKKGETLGGIAEKYKVSIASLQQLNNIKGNKIIAGQDLKIPRINRCNFTRTKRWLSYC